MPSGRPDDDNELRLSGRAQEGANGQILSKLSSLFPSGVAQPLVGSSGTGLTPPIVGDAGNLRRNEPAALRMASPPCDAEGRHTMVEFVNALVGLYLPEEREGQGLVEYALIIVLVSIAVIALLTLLGGQVGNVFSRITTSLN